MVAIEEDLEESAEEDNLKVMEDKGFRGQDDDDNSNDNAEEEEDGAVLEKLWRKGIIQRIQMEEDTEEEEEDKDRG